MPMLHFNPSKRVTAAEALQHPWLQGKLPSGALEADKASYRDHPMRDSRFDGKLNDHYARSKSRDIGRAHPRSSSPSPR